MLRYAARRSLFVVAAWCANALAGPVFTDSTFNLADYSASPTFLTGPGVSLTYTQCPSCGDPGTALQFTLSLTGSGTGAVGLVNNTFVYDPATQGAIQSIDASVDKFLSGDADPSAPGPFGNTFRPLIAQGGLYYLAGIPGPPAPSIPFTIPYHTIAQTGLSATDFTQFDFTTGTFGVAHPNFAGGTIHFGIGQISGLNGFNSALLIADYDNLTIGVIPEPATLAIFAIGLAGLGALRRRR